MYIYIIIYIYIYIYIIYRERDRERENPRGEDKYQVANLVQDNHPLMRVDGPLRAS